MIRDPQWVADRDAVLTLAALRNSATPRLYSEFGYAISGLVLWNDHSTISTPPEAMIDLFDAWYSDPEAHHQVSVQVWQIVMYGIAHDYLLPAMKATHYQLEFRPNRGGDNPVRATVPRPHHSDPIRYSTLAYIPWPELLARTIATLNACARAEGALVGG